MDGDPSTKCYTSFHGDEIQCQDVRPSHLSILVNLPALYRPFSSPPFQNICICYSHALRQLVVMAIISAIQIIPTVIMRYNRMLFGISMACHVDIQPRLSRMPIIPAAFQFTILVIVKDSIWRCLHRNSMGRAGSNFISLRLFLPVGFPVGPFQFRPFLGVIILHPLERDKGFGGVIASTARIARTAFYPPACS